MTARTGQRVGAQPSAKDKSSAAKARPEPKTSPAFEHLTLASLRAYRRTLTHEEGRVSYWRRLIQARLDVLRDDPAAPSTLVDADKVERLRGVLAEARPGDSRRALVTLVPIDDIPPLPDLQALWDRELHPSDPAHVEEVRRDLSFAELQLSAYRTALHDRLAAATQELIARYREDPSLCLSVLPSR